MNRRSLPRLAPLLLAMLLASPAQAQQRPPPEPSRGLLAAYALDGAAVDALSGSPARTSQVRPVDGPQGQRAGALWFDGVRSFADLGERFQPVRFTVSAWIRPERLEGQQVILSKIRNLQGHYQRNLELRLDPGGRLYLQVPGGAAWDGVQGRRAVPAGQWTHVAATYDGVRAQLWVDGEPDGAPLEVAYAQSRTALFVGARPESGGRDGRTVAGPAFYFLGAIADVRIWDRALDGREVREVAGREAPRPPLPPPSPAPAPGAAQLVARFPLDGDARDAAGQAEGRVVGQVRGAEDRLGNPGGALAFPGRDGWVDLGVRVEPERLSLAAWVRVTELRDDQVIFSKWSSAGGLSGSWLELRVNRAGTLVFALPGGGARPQEVRSRRALAKGRWTHVAAVYDGELATVFVDGVAEGQARLEPFEASRGPVFLGGRPDQQGQRARPWTSLTGRLDDVLLFRGALRAQEVAALASGAPLPAPSPSPAPHDEDLAAFLLSVDRYLASYDQAVIQRKGGELQALEVRVLTALEQAERDARADRNLRVAGYVRRAAAELREARGQLDAMAIDRKRSALAALSEALWNDLVEDVDGVPVDDPRAQGRPQGRWY